MKTTLGFSLIEVLIVIAIAMTLYTIAIPTYNHHLINASRKEAEITLSKLAVALEEYYTTHNSYQGATLTELHIENPKHYTLAITNTTNLGFTLSATPDNSQDTNDAACGTLSLTSQGEKGISGTSMTEECW